MATVDKITFTTTSTKAGTNAKALFDAIHELFPGWEIVLESLSDDCESYYVYFKMLDCPILFCFVSSSSYMHTRAYYENSEGASTIAGKTYSQITSSQNGALISPNTQRIIYAIRDEGVYERVIIKYPSSSSNFITYCSAKIIDMCSGEVRYGGSTADIKTSSSTSNPRVCDYLYVSGTNSYVQHYSGPICSSTYDNGYTRMSPSYIYSTDFFGLFANPSLTYYGYSAGAELNNTILSEFRVGGVNFLSYGDNYALRLDSTSEVI